MKRIFSVIIAFILLICTVFTGCTQPQPQNNPAESDGTVTVTDHAGETVTLPKKIERIAVCDIFPLPSVLTVFFGSADKIVAMSPTSMSAAKNGLLSELYPDILNADTSAISGTDVNTEELMKLNPQVVFYNASTSQLGEKLRGAGFNAVAVSVDKWDYNAVETLNEWIALLSEIFPESAGERAEKVRSYSDESVKLVKERTQKLTAQERKNIFFLFQYDESSLVTTGEVSFGQWWADSVGAVNAAAGVKESNSVKVTQEQVYSWNPDMIFISNFTTAVPEDLYKNTVGNYNWSGIKAVMEKQVYKMPLGLYRSFTPGADTPITLLWLAKAVYPDLFEDIDITAKTVDYYKTVFGVELTDKQAQSVFAPSSSAGKTDYQAG